MSDGYTMLLQAETTRLARETKRGRGRNARVRTLTPENVYYISSQAGITREENERMYRGEPLAVVAPEKGAAWRKALADFYRWRRRTWPVK